MTLQRIVFIVWMVVVLVTNVTDGFRPLHRHVSGPPPFPFSNPLLFQSRLRIFSPSSLPLRGRDVPDDVDVHNLAHSKSKGTANNNVGESNAIQGQHLIKLVQNPSRSLAERVNALKMLTTRRFQSIRNKSVADSIVQSLDEIVDRLDIDSFPDVIRSLGILKCSISESRHQPLIERLMQRTIDSLTFVLPNNKAKLLVGFGALGTHFTSRLSSTTLRNLHFLIDSALSQHRQLSKHSLFYLSYGMYLLRARFELLSPLAQTELVAMIQTVAQHVKQSSCDEKEAVCTNSSFPIAGNESLFLYHLSSLGVHKRHFHNSSDAPAFLQVANAVFRAVIAQNYEDPSSDATLSAVLVTANTLYAMGKSGFLYKECSPNLISFVHQAMVKTLPFMFYRDVSTSLYGLGLMSVPWNTLPTHLHELLVKRIMQVVIQMNPQALTNVLYGLCLMQTPMAELPATFQNAIHSRVAEFYTNNQQHFAKANKQSVSNILYSMANTGYQWSDIPKQTRDALLRGVNTYADYFIPQELSVTLSSLGTMHAPYAAVGSTIDVGICRAVQRLEPQFKILQSICTLLSGYAKMGAVWTDLPASVKDVAMRVIMEGKSPDDISVPCVLNALGQMEVKWMKQSQAFRTHIATLMQDLELREQSLTNIVFGVAMMEAKWESLQEDMRRVLLQALQRPASLQAAYPQHIANVLWGLGKLQVPRHELQSFHVVEYITPSAPRMNMKELAQVIYGMGMMELSWNELPIEATEALADAITMDGRNYTSQDISNMMYGMALLSFDVDFSILDASSEQQANQEKEYRIASSASRVFDCLLRHYSGHVEDWAVIRQQQDQYQIFLLLLQTIPSPAIATMMHREFPKGFPVVSGPSALVPSSTHARIFQHLDEALTSTSPEYEIFNEYLGCEAVFPMDMAVFHGESLIAFIEVDGAFHYRICPLTGSASLRRIDRIKEYIYRMRYPQVPVIRIAASKVWFTVIAEHIRQVILNEQIDFSASSGPKWRREWKSIILRDLPSPPFLPTPSETELDPAQALIRASSPAAEEDNYATQQGEETKSQMQVTVRRLIQRGTAFVEEEVPYAKELSRMYPEQAQQMSQQVKHATKNASGVNLSPNGILSDDGNATLEPKPVRKRSSRKKAALKNNSSCSPEPMEIVEVSTTKSQRDITHSVVPPSAERKEVLNLSAASSSSRRNKVSTSLPLDTLQNHWI